MVPVVLAVSCSGYSTAWAAPQQRHQALSGLRQQRQRLQHRLLSDTAQTSAGYGGDSCQTHTACPTHRTPCLYKCVVHCGGTMVVPVVLAVLAVSCRGCLAQPFKCFVAALSHC